MIVILTVEPHDVVFDPMPNGVRQAQIKFALVAYDADGKRVNFLDQDFAIRVKPKDMARLMTKTGIGARFGLDLPAGHEFLRIAVEDLNANRAGSLELPISVTGK